LITNKNVVDSEDVVVDSMRDTAKVAMKDALKEEKPYVIDINFPKEYIFLFLILILGAVLRYFYVSDGIFNIGGRFALEAYHLLMGVYDPNIIGMHVGIRYVQVALISLSFFFFGISEWSLYLHVFLSSMLSILIIYILGSKLFNKNVGLLSAFLLAVFPMDVLYATVVESDHIATFFLMLCFLFYYMADRSQRSTLLFFLSGFFLAASFFTKIFGLLFLPVLLFYEFFAEREHIRKRIFSVLIPFTIGFFLLVSPLFVYQYNATGDLFYNIHVERAMPLAIAAYEGFPVDWSFVTQPDFTSFPKYMFNVIPTKAWGEGIRDRTPKLHFYFLLLPFAFCYSFSYLRKHKKKELIFLSLWFVLTFFFLEFYTSIVKVERYLAIVAPPLLLLLGFATHRFYSRLKTPLAFKRTLLALFLILVFLFSIYQLGDFRVRAQTSDGLRYHAVEQVYASILKELPPKDIYITSYNQLSILNFYLGYEWNITSPLGFSPLGYRGGAPNTLYDLHFVDDYYTINDAYVLIQPYWFEEQDDLIGFYRFLNVTDSSSLYHNLIFPDYWVGVVQNPVANDMIFYVPPLSNDGT
jgi:4-amino-4-deoxy-L-arabinose transferase-like glycosyltransferase